MIEDELNKKIAQKCGWTDVRFSSGFGEMIGSFSNKFGTHQLPIPNYSGDLNCMYDAETFLDAIEREIYTVILNENSNYAPWHLTALEKAKAYVLSIDQK